MTILFVSLSYKQNCTHLSFILSCFVRIFAFLTSLSVYKSNYKTKPKRGIKLKFGRNKCLSLTPDYVNNGHNPFSETNFFPYRHGKSSKQL